jgi:hypothetical protein
MAQSTPRKRVTREDIRKREVKLDIVERKAAPPLSKRLMTLIILPVALWVVLPLQCALWMALAATALWLGFYGMLHAERKRDDFDTGREIALSIIRAGAFGLAIGCWTFLIVNAVVA